jgi:hypothetical protein
MTLCLSRRACADRYTIRLVGPKGEVGCHIWTELRCKNLAIGETSTCYKCSNKTAGCRFQANPKFDHGVIGGPYTTQSKLYGSSFYLQKINEGWKIAEQDEIRAKEALDKVYSDMPPRKNVTVDIPVSPNDPAVKKTRKPKTKKEQAPPVINTTTSLPAKFIEILAPPIMITEFIVVKVKKTRIQGKDYYFDSASGKLYTNSDGRVGTYRGRYNPEAEIIDTTYPDSDNE